MPAPGQEHHRPAEERTGVIRLTTRDLPVPVRLRGRRVGGMLLAIAFHGFFAIAMVVTRMQRL